ncbi:HERC1, partial [Symbiodinium sp. KB8]
MHGNTETSKNYMLETAFDLSAADWSEAYVFIMSMSFEVSLISGKTVSLQAHEEESVESLRVRAQRALGVGKGQLLSAAGVVLDGRAPLSTARLQNAEAIAEPEPLTLQIRRVDICGAGAAFAAIQGDGCMVTWGNTFFVQLQNVQQIQATGVAFAAILGDGSVATWGNADDGGDSNGVRDQLKNVQQVQAAEKAFAAILDDGSVVTWGDADGGGNSSAVREQLKNVQQIQATWDAFAAILGDGSVVTWGASDGGGDSSAVRDRLKNVQQIQATGSAFAAILGDGSVVTWGHADDGGNSSAAQDQLKNVQLIQSNQAAFAAILGDGSVVTWGDAKHDQLKNVQQIQATWYAFAAILGDGSVVTWGLADSGGNSSAVRDQLKNVQQIQATASAFAANLDDGSVVAWGDADGGGNSSAVREQLKNAQQIQATWHAFAAILGDGSVVTWGASHGGGDSSAVRDQLKNVQQIQANWSAFAAILGDGSVDGEGNAQMVHMPEALIQKWFHDPVHGSDFRHLVDELAKRYGALEDLKQANQATPARNAGSKRLGTINETIVAELYERSKWKRSTIHDRSFEMPFPFFSVCGEPSLGKFEGMVKHDIYSQYADMFKRLAKMSQKDRLDEAYFEGLETPAQTSSRAEEAAADVFRDLPDGATVLFVTHSKVLEAVLAKVFDRFYEG